MFFSVIIPTYNRANFITEALQSVKDQSFEDWEVIVVDDGSTDNTEEIVQEFILTEPRVKYIFQPNAERGRARNNGIAQANGEYLVFFDSDDLMQKEYLAELATIIKEHPGLGFLAMQFGEFKNKPEVFSVPNKNFISGTYTLSTFLEGNFLACNFCVVNDRSNPLFFLEHRKFVTAEDWVFVLQAVKKYKNMYWSSKVGVLMREHDNRSMGNNKKVIAARKACAEWVEENLSLSSTEIRKMKAYVAYFSAIHYYSDNDRLKAKMELANAIKLAGLNRLFVLLRIKIALGQSFVSATKTIKEKWL